MAFDSLSVDPGYPDDGLRRLDHMEGGVRGIPERIPGTDRFRLHGAGSQISNIYYLVWCWIVLGIAAISGGAVAEILAARGG